MTDTGVSQTDLDTLLQQSGGASSQGLMSDSMMQSFTMILLVSTIVSCVIVILFLVLYVISAIRKWKVQSAILQMQKDISEIKSHMISGGQRPSEASVPLPSDVVDRPAVSVATPSSSVRVRPLDNEAP